jgi:hypothetical protein
MWSRRPSSAPNDILVPTSRRRAFHAIRVIDRIEGRRPGRAGDACRGGPRHGAWPGVADHSRRAGTVVSCRATGRCEHEDTYSWETGFRQGLGRYAAWSFSWLNEGVGVQF